MKKLQKWWSGLPIIEKILIIIVLFLTIFRIWIALKTPLHIQGWAIYDDRMMVDYAQDISEFNWLGDFGRFTLTKGASYSIFLAINHFLGIPYSFSLIMLWVLAVILFCVAISKIIKSKKFLMILYSALLYTPVMFHDENVQKVYRGG